MEPPGGSSRFKSSNLPSNFTASACFFKPEEINPATSSPVVSFGKSFVAPSGNVINTSDIITTPLLLCCIVNSIYTIKKRPSPCIVAKGRALKHVVPPNFLYACLYHHRNIHYSLIFFNAEITLLFTTISTVEFKGGSYLFSRGSLQP